MQTMTKQTNGKAVQAKNGDVIVIPVSGELVFPKLTINGEVKQTSIMASFVAGVEKSVIRYKGKDYDGAKVYTILGDFFKVFANPQHIIAAKHHAVVNNELCNVEPVIALPGYSNVKALPSGK
jgi:hypothetical protein